MTILVVIVTIIIVDLSLIWFSFYQSSGCTCVVLFIRSCRIPSQLCRIPEPASVARGRLHPALPLFLLKKRQKKEKKKNRKEL